MPKSQIDNASLAPGQQAKKRGRIKPQASPLGRLAKKHDFDKGWLFARLSDPKSVNIGRLCDQFAQTVCDGHLEASMAMLAGCPALALLPCRKALFSALHWSCSIVSMSPLTHALLSLGCDPEGYPAPEHAGLSDRHHNSPIRWAVSSANRASLAALLSFGAKPEIDDLYEACRNAQGGCAIALMEAMPQADPFAPIGPYGQSCHQALLEAARTLRNPINADRLKVEQAASLFESMAISKCVTAEDQADAQSSKRL